MVKWSISVNPMIKVQFKLVLKVETLISRESSLYWKIQRRWELVVAQLAERSLPTPEDRGSNPVISNFIKTTFIYCIKKTKIKKNYTRSPLHYDSKFEHSGCFNSNETSRPFQWKYPFKWYLRWRWDTLSDDHQTLMERWIDHSSTPTLLQRNKVH